MKKIFCFIFAVMLCTLYSTAQSFYKNVTYDDNSQLVETYGVTVQTDKNDFDVVIRNVKGSTENAYFIIADVQEPNIHITSVNITTSANHTITPVLVDTLTISNKTVMSVVHGTAVPQKIFKKYNRSIFKFSTADINIITTEHINNVICYSNDNTVYKPKKYYNKIVGTYIKKSIKKIEKM